jgi:hypothetical protein
MAEALRKEGEKYDFEQKLKKEVQESDDDSVVDDIIADRPAVVDESKEIIEIVLPVKEVPKKYFLEFIN